MSGVDLARANTSQKVRAFDGYLASMSVEDLLHVQWFLQHRHEADMALLDEAIAHEEARRQQHAIEWRSA